MNGLTSLQHSKPLARLDLVPGCCCSSYPQDCRLGTDLARQEPAAESLAFETYLPRPAYFVKSLAAGFAWMIVGC